VITFNTSGLRFNFVWVKFIIILIHIIWFFDTHCTVFLSFLKRERERFPLFVPKRYCVTTRTFLDVLDRSTSLTVHRSWPLPWPFLTVPDRSWPFLTVLDRSWAFLTVSERFRPFYERFRSFSTVLWVFSVICDLYGRFDHNNIHVNKLSSYNVL